MVWNLESPTTQLFNSLFRLTTNTKLSTRTEHIDLITTHLTKKVQNPFQSWNYYTNGCIYDIHISSTLHWTLVVFVFDCKNEISIKLNFNEPYEYNCGGDIQTTLTIPSTNFKHNLWTLSCNECQRIPLACWLTAPSHYLNQCWLIISEVQWHSY